MVRKIIQSEKADGYKLDFERIRFFVALKLFDFAYFVAGREVDNILADWGFCFCEDCDRPSGEPRWCR